MSDKQTIDYDALAKQHGATNVDYDALAQQHGGRTESATAKSNTVRGRVMTAEPSIFSLRGLKSAYYNVADKITNLLPAAGGITGGIIGFGAGTPAPGAGNVGGAIIGAGIGGAAGESARQLTRRAIFPAGTDSSVPTSSLDAANDIGVEGAKQALYEAGGQGFRVFGKVMAPRVAEAAVAPGKRLLKTIPEDVNIGKTILKDTTAYNPKVITKQLEEKIAEHSKAADDLLADAALKGKKVPLGDARQLVTEEKAAAVSKNSPGYINDVQKVENQLNYQHAPGGGHGGNGNIATIPTTKTGAGFKPVEIPGPPQRVEIPAEVDPVRARSLRQGVDLEIGNWNPESQAAIDPLRRRVYGEITGKIHEAVPETAAHDAAMTQLIPAKEAAWNTSFNPGITRNIVERFARPTGALVGSVFGARQGYESGGVPGAIAGGVTGLVVPHVVTSPTGMMYGARALDRGVFSRGIRYAVPIGEGLIRPSGLKIEGLEDERPDEGQN